jgi:hypothetical protein
MRGLGSAQALGKLFLKRGVADCRFEKRSGYDPYGMIVLLIITPMLKTDSVHEAFRTRCECMALFSGSAIRRLKRNEGNHWRSLLLFAANRFLGSAPNQGRAGAPRR